MYNLFIFIICVIIAAIIDFIVRYIVSIKIELLDKKVNEKFEDYERTNSYLIKENKRLRSVINEINRNRSS